MTAFPEPAPVESPAALALAFESLASDTSDLLTEVIPHAQRDPRGAQIMGLASSAAAMLRRCEELARSMILIEPVPLDDMPPPF